MRIVNLTPHTLHIHTIHGTVVEVPPSGTVARVAEEVVQAGYIHDTGIEVTSSQFGNVTDLPKSEPETVYVVSRMVLDAANNRYDVLCPGPAIRDEAGRIVGCKGLSCSRQASEYGSYL